MLCICRSYRIKTFRIVLLDDTDFTCEISDSLPGKTLLDLVFARLNLNDMSYFGMRYVDADNQTQWLDLSSRISRQFKNMLEPINLYFSVKFYASDPCKLLEESTRYQLFMQVKQDVRQGRLPVSFELGAELGSLVIQSELGDFDPRRHLKGYVSQFRILPVQTTEIETRISDLHQQLRGMSPTMSEFNYLNKIKWQDMYGADLHSVLGEDSVEYFLALTPSGVLVLRDKTTVAHYYWPRIIKVYYKGKYLMLRICDKNKDMSTYGFETPKKSACKHLWRCCIEHQAFFRLACTVAPPSQSKFGLSDFLGSGTHYNSKHEKNVIKEIVTASRTSNSTILKKPQTKRSRRGVVVQETGDIIDDRSSRSLYREDFLPSTMKGCMTAGRSTLSIPSNFRVYSYGTNKDTNTTCNSVTNEHISPWPKSQQKGLFGNPVASPRSVRSTSTRNSLPSKSNHRCRSSSVESQSSTDSRLSRRHKHHHRRSSDNDSEFSRSSARSGQNRKHRKSRHRRDSGSEHESIRAQSNSGHRVKDENHHLIDSKRQWKEVQRQKADENRPGSVQLAQVTKSTIIARNKTNDSAELHHKSRRHKKTRSPADNPNRIRASTLSKYLQFELVDTADMTQDQLKEIPYTVVNSQQTHSRKSDVFLNNNNNRSRDNINRIKSYGISSHQDKLNPRPIHTNNNNDRQKNHPVITRMMSNMSMEEYNNNITSMNTLSPPLENIFLTTSHEHSDSGLGADQDYAYSSERSSGSTRYGTKKNSIISMNGLEKFSTMSMSINSEHLPKLQYNNTPIGCEMSTEL